jgi:hypothetical protein
VYQGIYQYTSIVYQSIRQCTCYQYISTLYRLIAHSYPSSIQRVRRYDTKWYSPYTRAVPRRTLLPHEEKFTAYVTLVYDTNNTTIDPQDQGPAQVIWDTDSFPIRVDNCCTRTLTFEIKDFIPSTLQDVTNKVVSGFVADTSTPITKMGTIRWNIMDDTGTAQQIQVPNSYYVPAGTTRLLSPQHWAQESADTFPLPHGTRCITTAESVVLEWEQNKHSKTIALDPTGNNVGTMWSEPGYVIANTLIDSIQAQYGDLTLPPDPIAVQTPDPLPADVDADGLYLESVDATPLTDWDRTHTVQGGISHRTR